MAPSGPDPALSQRERGQSARAISLGTFPVGAISIAKQDAVLPCRSELAREQSERAIFREQARSYIHSERARHNPTPWFVVKV
ncbi:hypothetical protein DM872_18100 [Pseudomonas taiwanensis]|nr:hypothetical protein [Pseudomonas taiwanensis]